MNLNTKITEFRSNSLSVRCMALFLILGILLFRDSFVYCQDDPINLVPAIPSSQLPEIDINSIAQDSAGFIWIGTWKGLYRYDGRNVINYSQQLNTKIGRKISTLYLDYEGKLWIGTYSEGLFIYNPKNQKIISFQSINNIKTGNIINISGGAGNKIYVASYEGIFIYDISKAGFDPQTLIYAEAGNSYRITMSFQDSKGNLWIGSDLGLLRYNQLTKRIENTSYLKGTYIHQILELSNGWLAVSSLKGTDLFDAINGVLVPITNTPLASILATERGESYTSMQLKSDPDLFWIALQNGLMITDLKTGTLLSKPVIISGKEIKTIRVESFFED
ncbi:MAG: ligand-binding sensor domain-containing protein, partial [Bacteroidales bacterium]